MRYEIFISDEKVFVVVRIVGDFTRHVGVMLAEKAISKASEYQITRYLFDLRNSLNTDSAFNKYAYAYQDMARLNLDPQARIALLTNPTDKSHDFVETVMHNAGFNVSLFSEEKFAVSWLSENSHH
ncbi:MAG: hypothetical protein E4H13_14275 [Calditrichales bacterium]|nr:MAG: hypothetical protein E4H13_14275 [Calditrichales bacterium]